MKNKIYIMDTTLRDGEQTSGVSFSESEKLNIAKILLEEVRVDYLEIASARVSEGELLGAKKVMAWANGTEFHDKIEILGFVDGSTSLEWIASAGGKVINLLGKGSLRHVTQQLKKSPEQHLADIKKSIALATKMNISVNLYLEDWSNGMRNSPEYVDFMLDGLKDEPIRRMMLPDTLGILSPTETFQFCSTMIRNFPMLHFDFHAHNDYDLAVANVDSALRAGIKTIHTTINGLGERAGNAPLSSVVALLNDHLKLSNSINEHKLNMVSRLVETFSGIHISSNKPIIGENVFTQCSGIHADGDNKDNLYYNDLLPERFGRTRKYALGKTSGKANIAKNLEDMGIRLDPENLKRVTDKVIELADKKESVTSEDLPYILSDVLKSETIFEKITLRNYAISHALGLRPMATVCIELNGELYEEAGSGDGQYDAFMNALQKIYHKLHKKMPALVNYTVTIPPGGKTDALVETLITWELGREFKTRGLDPDQTAAAIKATIKMLNIIESDGQVY
ncbi:MAG: alpha-isopropylmalate synthase regulatory domain-containing protein [Prolixibacteraceae bacterium]